MKKKLYTILPFLLALSILFGGCSLMEDTTVPASVVSLDEIPEFRDSPYVEIDGQQNHLKPTVTWTSWAGVA